MVLITAHIFAWHVNIEVFAVKCPMQVTSEFKMLLSYKINIHKKLQISNKKKPKPKKQNKTKQNKKKNKRKKKKRSETII